MGREPQRRCLLDLTRGATSAAVVTVAFDEARRLGTGVLAVHAHRRAAGFADCAETVFGPVVEQALARGVAKDLTTRCRLAPPGEALAQELSGVAEVVVGAGALARHREASTLPDRVHRPTLVVPRRTAARERHGVLLVLDAARPSAVAARAAVDLALERDEALRVAVHDRTGGALEALGRLLGQVRHDHPGLRLDVEVVAPDVRAIRSALPDRLLTVVAVSDPTVDAGPQAWLHEGDAVEDLSAPLLLVPDPELCRGPVGART